MACFPDSANCLGCNTFSSHLAIDRYIHQGDHREPRGPGRNILWLDPKSLERCIVRSRVYFGMPLGARYEAPHRLDDPAECGSFIGELDPEAQQYSMGA